MRSGPGDQLPVTRVMAHGTQLGKDCEKSIVCDAVSRDKIIVFNQLVVGLIKAAADLTPVGS